jgi:hypothetical protein
MFAFDLLHPARKARLPDMYLRLLVKASLAKDIKLDAGLALVVEQP